MARSSAGARNVNWGLALILTFCPVQRGRKAREAKSKLEAGIDPIAERKATRAALMAAARRG